MAAHPRSFRMSCLAWSWSRISRPIRQESLSGSVSPPVFSRAAFRMSSKVILPPRLQARRPQRIHSIYNGAHSVEREQDFRRAVRIVRDLERLQKIREREAVRNHFLGLDRAGGYLFHYLREFGRIAGRSDNADLLTHDPGTVEGHRVTLHGDGDDPAALVAEIRDLGDQAVRAAHLEVDIRLRVGHPEQLAMPPGLTEHLGRR